MRIAVTAAFAALLIASCQQETSPEMTTTTAPTSTTAAVPPPDADPFPPEELIGTWRVGISYLRFSEGGTLEVWERPGEAPYERGTWEIDGAILSLMSDPGYVCNPEVVGRYWIRWADDRSRLLATTIEDACHTREENVRNGFPPVTED